jgi:hypothetical protein
VVEDGRVMGYFNVVPETLEERVDTLEKRVTELAAVVRSKAGKKDWLATVGTWPDDPISRDAERLGREYRDSLGASDCAGA